MAMKSKKTQVKKTEVKKSEAKKAIKKIVMKAKATVSKSKSNHVKKNSKATQVKAKVKAHVMHAAKVADKKSLVAKTTNKVVSASAKISTESVTLKIVSKNSHRGMGAVANPKLAAALEAQAKIDAQLSEEAQLQLELAREIEKEADQTNKLVKADFTPVNSSRDKLVVEYAPLIKYVAQKIAARLPANIELDDLISSGVIGLMDAIDKYDSKRDNKFKTYAEFRVRGAILDELRAHQKKK
jgi:DNA-directed RNA polymerase sigma subunit (sigma70/sigma32)